MFSTQLILKDGKILMHNKEIIIIIRFENNGEEKIKLTILKPQGLMGLCWGLKSYNARFKNGIWSK